MKNFPSTDITRKSAEIFDSAIFEPVGITKYRKRKFVVMSAAHYDKLVDAVSGREVFSLDTVPDDVREEMLLGIDRELDRD